MRYLFFIGGLLLFTACVSTPEQEGLMELSGKVRDLKRGKLLLRKYEDSVLITVDSVILNGVGNFNFSKNIEEPEVFILDLELENSRLQDNRILFFAEPKNITIQTRLQSFGHAAVISGSENDSLYRNYNHLKQRYVSKNLELIERRLRAQRYSDTVTIAEINRRQLALLTNHYLATVNYALNHSQYEIAPYLVLYEAPDVNVKYLDTVYNSLSSKIKNSRYGKELELFIQSQKEPDSVY